MITNRDSGLKETGHTVTTCPTQIGDMFARLSYTRTRLSVDIISARAHRIVQPQAGNVGLATRCLRRKRSDRQDPEPSSYPLVRTDPLSKKPTLGFRECGRRWGERMSRSKTHGQIGYGPGYPLITVTHHVLDSFLPFLQRGGK